MINEKNSFTSIENTEPIIKSTPQSAEEEIERLSNELEQSRQLFNDLFNNSSIAYFIVNKGYKIIDFNKYGSKLLGIESAILRNANFNDFISIHSKETISNLIDEVYKKDIRKKGEITFPKENIEIFAHVEVSLLGNTGNCILTILDITEHVVNEIKEKNAFQKIEESLNELKKSQRQTSNILSSIIECHFTLDKNWRFIEINDKAADDFGLKREQLLGNSYWDLFPISVGSDIEKKFKEAVYENTPVHFEIHTVKNTWNEYHIFPVEEGLLAYYRDITERKHSEEALRKSELIYRAIGETIDYGIWICTPDGRNIYASDSFLKLVGQTQEECSNFGWANVLHPDDAERTITAWKECVKRGGKWDIEHRYKSIDGNWHHILARGVPVRDEQGKIICWAGINLDINHQKQIQQELLESKIREQQRANDLEVILNTIPAAIWIVNNIEGTDITGNITANEILRISRNQNASEIIKNTENEGIQLLHKGKRIPIHDLPLNLALKGKTTRNYELQIIYPEGNSIDLIGNIIPLFNNEGKIKGSIAALTNITPLKRIEKSLRESERKFKSITENSPDLIMRLDRDYNILFANHRIKDLTGIHAREFSGKKYSDLSISETQKNIWEQLFAKALKTKKIQEAEVEFPHGNTTLIFNLRIIPELNEEGLVGSYMAILRDITVKIATENALKENEQKFSQLANAITQLAWIAKLDGYRTWYNDRWYQYTGTTFKEMEGWGWLTVQDLEESPTLIDNWKKYLAGKEPFELIHGIKGKDGFFKQFLTRVVPLLDEQGEVINWFGTNTDISEIKQIEKSLKESEEKYRMLFEFMPIGLEIINEKREILFGNEKFREYTGLSTITQNSHQGNFKIIHKDGNEYKLEEYPSYRILNEKKSIYNIEIGLESNDKVRWLNASAAPMPNNKEFLIAYHDITEKIEREKELQKVSDQLKHLNETKDKLFIIIAHDLRNPFTSLMGFSEVLITQHEQYNSDEVKKYLGIIYDSAKQAHTLLENLLNWSRSQTGTLEFKPEKMDIRSLVVNNIKVVHNIALKKSIQISLHIEKDEVICADKNMIDAVMRNLLSNAIKFSYTGSKILVSVANKETEVVISIKDQGVGIEKENLKKLFDINNKFTSLGTNKEKGSGLGLVLCKEFVEKNQGKIYILSEVGKGSTVSFTLQKAN